MPIELYKLLHILGLALLMVSVGGLALHAINGGTRDTNAGRKLAATTHGIGLLLLLVGGFGMLARGGGGFPPWAVGKLVIWLLLGAVVMPLGRKPALGKALWIVVPLLAVAAASLGVYKPEM